MGKPRNWARNAGFSTSMLIFPGKIQGPAGAPTSAPREAGPQSSPGGQPGDFTSILPRFTVEF